MSEEVTVYIAPNIRELALHTLTERAEQRRNRRLLNAIELNQTKQLKMRKQASASSEKFRKSVEKAQKFQDQINDLMAKMEAEIRNASALHNAMILLEGEIKE